MDTQGNLVDVIVHPARVSHNVLCSISKFILSTFNPNSYLDSDKQLSDMTDSYIANTLNNLVTTLVEDTKLAAGGAAVEIVGLVATIMSALHG